MYCVRRCGNGSPEGWRHLRLRPVHVCTRLNLSARWEKLWLPPLTPLQPEATTGTGSPPRPGTVQMVPSEAPASAKATWEEGTSGRNRNVWDFDQWETGKGRDPADNLPASCVSARLTSTEVLRYSLSEVMAHDQVTTSVLCWRCGWLSHITLCCSSTFPDSSHFPPHSCFLELHAQPPLPQTKC